jgi:hypothetical protein
MWRCHDLRVGDSVTQVAESTTLAVDPALFEFRYANGNTLLFFFQPVPDKSSYRGAALSEQLLTYRPKNGTTPMNLSNSCPDVGSCHSAKVLMCLSDGTIESCDTRNPSVSTEICPNRHLLSFRRRPFLNSDVRISSRPGHATWLLLIPRSHRLGRFMLFSTIDLQARVP